METRRLSRSTETRDELLERASTFFRDLDIEEGSPAALVRDLWQELVQDAPALPNQEDGCSCTPHVQNAGGGHFEHLLEYDPACPEHSEHLYDPRAGHWIRRADDERVKADAAAQALEAAADEIEIRLTVATTPHGVVTVLKEGTTETARAWLRARAATYRKGQTDGTD